jgi:beta-1,4-mannosyl-glycoprotein beta-1,4-N-acetylglucosaminyltransferase
MKIFDCFPFLNELDLLEIRLNELYDVVDYFVLAEATKTHSGNNKPLYYHMNKSRFADFQDKIIHLIIDDMPMTEEEINNAITPRDKIWLESEWQFEGNWVRERFQRNAIMRAIKDADPRDIIIIEDADEMIRAEVVANLDTIMADSSIAIDQSLHTYYLNWKCTNMEWQGSKVLRREFVNNLSEHRCHTLMAKRIYNGGWHFNFLGGAEAIKAKLVSFAHQEFNVDEVMDNIQHRLNHRKDALGRLYKYEIVPIDGTYPKYIIDNLDKYKHWIYRGE